MLSGDIKQEVQNCSTFCIWYTTMLTCDKIPFTSPVATAYISKPFWLSHKQTGAKCLGEGHNFNIGDNRLKISSFNSQLVCDLNLNLEY